MLKKLNSIKLNKVFTSEVKNVTLTKERVIFSFGAGIPEVNYIIPKSNINCKKKMKKINKNF